MKVVDVVLYSYEYDALAERFRALDGHVDLHVVVQATRDFRDRPREQSPVPHPFTDTPTVSAVVDSQPHHDPWAAEIAFRDAAALAGIQAGDSVAGRGNYRLLLADADEIVNPAAITEARYSVSPMILETDLRYWHAGLRAPNHPVMEHQAVMVSPENVVAYGGNSCRWDSRQRGWPVAFAKGWHLSSYGTPEMVQAKISQFAHSEYDTPDLNNVERLQRLYEARRDPFDRFDLVETSDLPPHLMVTV